MTCSSSKSLSQTDPLNNKGSLHQAETHQVVNDQEQISLKVVRDLKGIAHKRKKTKQRYGNHTIQELDDEIRSSALASQHCKSSGKLSSSLTANNFQRKSSSIKESAVKTTETNRLHSAIQQQGLLASSRSPTTAWPREEIEHIQTECSKIKPTVAAGQNKAS